MGPVRPVSLVMIPAIAVIAVMIVIAVIAGCFIYKGSDQLGRNEYNNWQEQYEHRYKRFQNMPQPMVSSVQTEIDLYPSQNRYSIRGDYTIINRTSGPIDSMLLRLDKGISWDTVAIGAALMLSDDREFGHRWYRFPKPLAPGDSQHVHFAFRYEPSSFRGFGRFNNVLTNGAFLRISNFFPHVGYNEDQEISNPAERSRRGMQISTAVPELKQPLNGTKQIAQDDDSGQLHQPHDYGFIDLQTTISTDAGQTVVAVGNLEKTWTKNNRNYFHFKTDQPIPFRFALSSAKYHVKSLKQGGTTIHVYHHPAHARNINHMLQQAAASLAYFEKHFCPYPYPTANFAEISSFTDGFAATAYPGTFFVNERFGFTHRFDGDTAIIKDRDIINEQVGHELSHTWWGNATFVLLAL
ncbi:MAG: hypothetical protein EOP49_40555, partial [Sphingobacteriales bacterium]